MKFGGSSVGDTEAINRAIGIVADRAEERPIVVLSAIAGATDELHKIARDCSDHPDNALQIAENLKNRHFNIIEELKLDEKNNSEAVRVCEQIFVELIAIIRGCGILNECGEKTLYRIATLGEFLSSSIFASACSSRGLAVKIFDSRRIVLARGASYGHSKADFEKTKTNCRKFLRSEIENGMIPVLQGYVGADEFGDVRALGRSGSDYSAALIGAALGAREIQIWKDVPGLMTADPRLIPNARIVDEVSFAEAADLSYFGAKLLHPEAAIPAIRSDIPVRILNSNDPKSSGTKISGRSKTNDVKCLILKENLLSLKFEFSKFGEASRFVEKIEAFDLNPYALKINRRGAFIVLDSESPGLGPFAAAGDEPYEIKRIDAVAVCGAGENLGSLPEYRRKKLTETLFDILPNRVFLGETADTSLIFLNENSGLSALKTLHSVLFET